MNKRLLTLKEGAVDEPASVILAPDDVIEDSVFSGSIANMFGLAKIIRRRRSYQEEFVMMDDLKYLTVANDIVSKWKGEIEERQRKLKLERSRSLENFTRGFSFVPRMFKQLSTGLRNSRTLSSNFTKEKQSFETEADNPSEMDRSPTLSSRGSDSDAGSKTISPEVRVEIPEESKEGIVVTSSLDECTFQSLNGDSNLKTSDTNSQRLASFGSGAAKVFPDVDPDTLSQ